MSLSDKLAHSEIITTLAGETVWFRYDFTQDSEEIKKIKVEIIKDPSTWTNLMQKNSTQALNVWNSLNIVEKDALLIALSQNPECMRDWVNYCENSIDLKSQTYSAAYLWKWHVNRHFRVDPKDNQIQYYHYSTGLSFNNDNDSNFKKILEIEYQNALAIRKILLDNLLNNEQYPIVETSQYLFFYQPSVRFSDEMFIALIKKMPINDLMDHLAFTSRDFSDGSYVESRFTNLIQRLPHSYPVLHHIFKRIDDQGLTKAEELKKKLGGMRMTRFVDQNLSSFFELLCGRDATGPLWLGMDIAEVAYAATKARNSVVFREVIENDVVCNPQYMLDLWNASRAAGGKYIDFMSHDQIVNMLRAVKDMRSFLKSFNSLLFSSNEKSSTYLKVINACTAEQLDMLFSDVSIFRTLLQKQCFNITDTVFERVSPALKQRLMTEVMDPMYGDASIDVQARIALCQKQLEDKTVKPVAPVAVAASSSSSSSTAVSKVVTAGGYTTFANTGTSHPKVAVPVPHDDSEETDANTTLLKKKKGFFSKLTGWQ